MYSLTLPHITSPHITSPPLHIPITSLLYPSTSFHHFSHFSRPPKSHSPRPPKPHPSKPHPTKHVHTHSPTLPLTHYPTHNHTRLPPSQPLSFILLSTLFHPLSIFILSYASIPTSRFPACHLANTKAPSITPSHPSHPPRPTSPPHHPPTNPRLLLIPLTTVLPHYFYPPHALGAPVQYLPILLSGLNPPRAHLSQFKRWVRKDFYHPIVLIATDCALFVLHAVL